MNLEQKFEKICKNIEQYNIEIEKEAKDIDNDYYYLVSNFDLDFDDWRSVKRKYIIDLIDQKIDDENYDFKHRPLSIDKINEYMDENFNRDLEDLFTYCIDCNNDDYDDFTDSNGEIDENIMYDYIYECFKENEKRDTYNDWFILHSFDAQFYHDEMYNEVCNEIDNKIDEWQNRIKELYKKIIELYGFKVTNVNYSRISESMYILFKYNDDDFDEYCYDNEDYVNEIRISLHEDKHEDYGRLNLRMDVKTVDNIMELQEALIKNYEGVIIEYYDNK